MNKQEISNKINIIENKLLLTNKKIEDLDRQQFAQKILINRVYGSFANKYSPFYDIDIASSITLTGQACIKETSNIVSSEFTKKYDVTESCVVYNDTDSVFITIDPILKKLNKKILTDSGKLTRDVYDIAESLEKTLNIQITDWAHNSCNIIDSRFVFKRESICDAGIFIQKKRYILHILDDEGIPEDKIKYVGVEVASTSIPKKVKPLIKNIVETLMKTRDYKTTNNAYMNALEEYKKLNIEDIATARGITNYDKYAKKATGFETPLGTPGHVKAAHYYNVLLDKLNLQNKYEKISSGDKIKLFYCEKNKYNIDCIGYLNVYPTEFDLKPNINVMFNKSVTAAVERIYDVINWRVKNPTSNTVCDLLDLLG
jgi:DNA polymerase elongation subunit (family B)